MMYDVWYIDMLQLAAHSEQQMAQTVSDALPTESPNYAPETVFDVAHFLYTSFA
eukprot:SAG31_NODE_35381_length_323_cov_1.379464_1_plen_53_part_01